MHVPHSFHLPIFVVATAFLSDVGAMKNWKEIVKTQTLKKACFLDPFLFFHLKMFSNIP